jgi:hypothetical protein
MMFSFIHQIKFIQSIHQDIFNSLSVTIFIYLRAIKDLLINLLNDEDDVVGNDLPSPASRTLPQSCTSEHRSQQYG